VGRLWDAVVTEDGDAGKKKANPSRTAFNARQIGWECETEWKDLPLSHGIRFQRPQEGGRAANPFKKPEEMRRPSEIGTPEGTQDKDQR